MGAAAVLGPFDRIRAGFGWVHGGGVRVVPGGEGADGAVGGGGVAGDDYHLPGVREGGGGGVAGGREAGALSDEGVAAILAELRQLRAEVAAIREAEVVRATMTTEEIAQHTGRTPKTVCNWLQKRGHWLRECRVPGQRGLFYRCRVMGHLEGKAKNFRF